MPFIIDRSNMIAAGHGRYLAAEYLKMESVPCIRVEFLSDEDRRAFAIADNRLSELSTWDENTLTQELTILFEGGYDLDITGFSTADLDFSLPEESVPDEQEQVELPEPGAEAVSQLGDLWEIGPHRLICGDARDATCWEALLGEDLATLVFGDLPYNVPINGFVSGNGKTQHREFVMGAGEMSPPEFTAFLRAIFRNCARFSQNGSIHYQCMDFRHIREILDAADGVYDQFKQLVVWDKGRGGQGSFYRNQHELVFVFKSGKAKHINNFGLGETGRYRTNIVKYAGAGAFQKGGARDLADHSTIKPTALVADFILDCSQRGDLVVDPSSGSGSTLAAAHHTGRRGAAIELDPRYVDTALRRLMAASDLVPVLANDGRSFDEIAAFRSQAVEV